MLDIFYWIFWIMFWIVKLLVKLLMVVIPLAFRFLNALPKALEYAEYWFVENVYDFSCFEPENIAATRLLLLNVTLCLASAVLACLHIDGDNVVKQYFGVTNRPWPTPEVPDDDFSPPSPEPSLYLEATSTPRQLSTFTAPSTPKVDWPWEHFSYYPRPSADHIPKNHYVSDWRYFLTLAEEIQTTRVLSPDAKRASDAPGKSTRPAPTIIERIVPEEAPPAFPQHPREQALLTILGALNGMSDSFVRGMHYWQDRNFEEVAKAKKRMERLSKAGKRAGKITKKIVGNDELYRQIMISFMNIVELDLTSFAGDIPWFDLREQCPWTQEIKAFWETLIPKGFAIQAAGDEKEIELLEKLHHLGNFLELGLQPLEATPMPLPEPRRRVRFAL